MDSIIFYLLKVSLVQVVLYFFYLFLFRNNTLHAFNRATLLSVLPFSFIAPLANLKIFLFDEAESILLIKGVVTDYTVIFPEFAPGSSLGSSGIFFKIVLIVYAAVVLLLVVRFIFQVYKIVRLKNGSQQYKVGKFSFFVSNKVISPFTFFRWVFIPTMFDNSEKYSTMRDHEIVHAAKLHTLDLIVVELYCIILWFNPFVYLFRKSLKNVHEFTADSSIATSSSAKEKYLMQLLASTVHYEILELTNPFYYKSFKKRVEMITKNKTPQRRKFEYILYIILVAFVFQAFSFSTFERPVHAQNYENAAASESPTGKPVDNAIVSLDYGVSFTNPFTKKVVTHNGIDFKAPIGTPVKSTANGVVVESLEKGNWGNLVVIQHGDDLQTWYAHLNEFVVKKGDTVSKGQVIGYVGNTGQSTGSHLHYMVMKNGETVNPNDYF